MLCEILTRLTLHDEATSAGRGQQSPRPADTQSVRQMCYAVSMFGASGRVTLPPACIPGRPRRDLTAYASFRQLLDRIMQVRADGVQHTAKWSICTMARVLYPSGQSDLLAAGQPNLAASRLQLTSISMPEDVPKAVGSPIWLWCLRKFMHFAAGHRPVTR